MQKKVYKKPALQVINIDKAVMVAASRSGMGNCKVTFLS